MASEQQSTKKKLIKKSTPFLLPTDSEKVTILEQNNTQPVYPYVPSYAPQMMIPQQMAPEPYMQTIPAQQVLSQPPSAMGAANSKQPLKKASKPFEKAEQKKQAAADDYFSDLGGDSVKQGRPSPIYNAVRHLPGPNGMQPMYMVPGMDQNMMDALIAQEAFDDPEEYDPELLADLPDDVLDDFEHEYFESQIDEIMRDLEQFEEKMKDCTCCHGYVYACKGKMCQNLGKCQCMVHEEMENQAIEDFIPECKDCACCRGYVYTCLGKECQELKACKCFVGMDED